MLPHSSNPARAVAYADRLGAALSRPLTIGGRDLRLKVSVSLALAADEALDGHDLVRRAGTALRRARPEAPASLYDGTMRADLLRQIDIDAVVDRLIAMEHVTLGYQPVVDVVDGKTIGAEALLRATDTEGTPIPATELVAAAERSGRMNILGDLVLQQACREAAHWRRTPYGRSVTVSVNVSAHQIDDPGFARRVDRALRGPGLDPAALCLELTETTFTRHTVRTDALLTELKASGIYLSVDDFGTGYSSLAALKRFPIDELKIDGSLVAGLPHDAEDRAITEAVHTMASALGLTVVAEGVEREDQRQALLAMGTTRAQGYLWSEALDFDSFVDRLRQEVDGAPLGRPASTGR